MAKAKDGIIVTKFKACRRKKSEPTRPKNLRKKPTRGQGRP